MGSYEHRLVDSVGSLVMTSIPLAPKTLLPSLQQNSLSSVQSLALGHCIRFYQLLDKGSLIKIWVVTSLITEDSQLRLLIHYC